MSGPEHRRPRCEQPEEGAKASGAGFTGDPSLVTGCTAGHVEVQSVPYDEQTSSEQAVTRRRWEAEIERLRSELNYEERFERDGSAFSTLDADGNVVLHSAQDRDEA